ncbi:MAG: hypothetical protein ACRC68_18810 [Clostridium sp.]
MSEVLEIFDENYMHKTVFNEINRTASSVDAKTHLEKLEQQGFIEILDDSILLDMLYDGLNNNEAATCKYFSDCLNQNIKRMTISKKDELFNAYKNIIENKY